jgi:hypothetical protein
MCPEKNRTVRTGDRMWALLLVAYLDVAILGGVALVAHYVEGSSPIQKSQTESCLQSDTSPGEFSGNCDSPSTKMARTSVGKID